MDRRHLPLVLASDRFAPATEKEPLDRLRMQKGVFLLEMMGSDAWKNAYEFVAWDWGPFSRDLATDLNRMVYDGLMDEEPVQLRRYGRYRTAVPGEELIGGFVAELSQSQIDYLARVRAYVTSRSFSQLLREVYAKFPKYAEASRFRH